MSVIKRLFLTVMLVALTLAWPSRVAVGQQPRGPTIRYQSRFEVANPPAQFDAVQIVQHFAAGAWTPPHSHGGQGYATVLEGEITIRNQGGEKKYKTGETFIENAHEVLQAGNTGTAKTSFVITFLLPKGPALTTAAPTASGYSTGPGPNPVYQSRLAVDTPPAQFDLVQIVQEFVPGARTTSHSHGGQGLATVLDGEITIRDKGGENKYKVGETFVETAGEVLQAGNSSDATARFAITFLLPAGAALTTPAPAPAMLPQTGTSPRQTVVWLLGALLLTLGVTLRRRQALSM